jgi:triphosphatase
MAVRHQDPEGVHLMRVGLRRLRAAISLFRELIAGPQTEAIKKELKWLTGTLAPARDLDVFVSDSVTPLRQTLPVKPGAVTLQKDVEQRRARAFGRAKAAVTSRRYRALVLDTLAWLEAGDWTRSDDPLIRALRRRPVAAFAADELKRRRKKVLKKAKKLESLAPARRHKLRIAVKKLRYATDFFAGVFPGRKAGKRRKQFERHLGGLQDGLGALNDIAVHEKLAADIAHEGPRLRPGSRRRAFAAGVVTGQDEARIRPLLEAAAAAATDLAKAKPFWR